MKKNLFKTLGAFLLIFTIFCSFVSCSDPELPGEPVTLTIVGQYTDGKAIEAVAELFKEKHSNVTILYEKIDDYYNNAPKRMRNDTPSKDKIDLFFTGGIQTTSKGTVEFLPYALNLKENEKLDLSKTFKPLSDNFSLREDTEIQYSIPMGGEMRGMFVNISLLKSVGINTVPTKQSEFLAACKTLSDAGYIPTHGNPGSAYAQWLIYPWICNLIANANDPAAAKELIENKNGVAAAELLKEPYTFLYNLCKDNYYNYKYAQESLDLFNASYAEDYARYFFNLIEDKDDGDAQKITYKKKDNTAGQIAFVPAPMSYSTLFEEVKENYRSDIEYVFVPAPIGENGGYVYLSPTDGIAINKYSDNLDWAIEFMNFLFTPEVNKVFAEEFNGLPNIDTIFQYVTDMYNVPENNICHLGEVTFSWDFYTAATGVAVVTSKSNKPSTITSNNGVMIELQWYLDKLVNAITTGKADMKETKQ